MATNIEIATGILLLGVLVPYIGAMVGMKKANLGGEFFALPVLLIGLLLGSWSSGERHH